ncbi:unnamed protein product [Didymodactylos carnosus]|uniref:Insertion element IS150 protein InsJ-like helix-turn-helix domain-containing protein n=1 Tax=Didymodactylos carnosus TaxID=1234261 RepID=A0A8S2E6K2_9BILA|nr:unnamed protein product [Didymodactylos carnosus]CAF3863675.1 unnamed protein product [Didymodactylos carnosus]
MQKLDDNNDRQSDKNKTKRRARSTDEKLAAIKYYKAVKSYKQVAKEHGCSRKMIRTWASQEQNLLSLRGEKTGKNLKRLEGAGKNYAISERVLNLGAKVEIPERDICNMDESPLALWGDQSRASLNYVNTSNEVDSYTWDSDDVLTLSYVLGSSFDPKLINFGDDDNDKKRESGTPLI